MDEKSKHRERMEEMLGMPKRDRSWIKEAFGTRSIEGDPQDGITDMPQGRIVNSPEIQAKMQRKRDELLDFLSGWAAECGKDGDDEHADMLMTAVREIARLRAESTKIGTAPVSGEGIRRCNHCGLPTDEVSACGKGDCPLGGDL